MDTLLIVATILRGLAAIWQFWDKLRAWICGGTKPNQHDIDLYEQYKALIVSSGVAEFYRQHDFLCAFEEAYWTPFSRYVDTWDTVEHEFVDNRLNKTHKNLYASALKLATTISKNTVPTGPKGYLRSVKPDHLVRGPTPEHIKNEAREINCLVPSFIKAHQKFIRLANRRLRRSVA